MSDVVYFGRAFCHSIDGVDLAKSDPHKYGLPEIKKFPMPDAKHVRSAIKFFNYVTPDYEEKLAKAILKRMKECGITDINVGDDNRFKKYYERSRLTDHEKIQRLT